jgi:hypothetical protein
VDGGRRLVAAEFQSGHVAIGVVNGMPQSYPMAPRNKGAQQRVCALVAHAARL